MKLSFWSSFAIILILINLFLLYHKRKSDKEIYKLQFDLKTQSVDYEENMAISSWHYLLPFEIYQQRIELTKTIETTNRDELPIKDALGAGGKWVFRYFNTSCLTCYEESLELIRDHINKESGESFMVFTDFSEVNQLRNFKSKLHFECGVYSIRSFISFSAEESRIPYFVYINSDGKLGSAFVIQKDKLDDISIFLNTISNAN